jgi:hypothetical protein
MEHNRAVGHWLVNFIAFFIERFHSLEWGVTRTDRVRNEFRGSLKVASLRK